ncbi:MAG TPA: AAA family ATPase [Polyangiaceae bacterium]|nr:AAA family ATPase [Polyangiaceae bacterium]
MHLLRMRMTRLGPFEEISLDFSEEGTPRPISVVHGGGGTGKTTMLAALACTRPGYAVVTSTSHDGEEPGVSVCEFQLGQDDPERPHPLVVASPNTRVFADEDRETFRRREQALFDRVARETGFVFLAIPATRWFSRQPIALVGPGRSIARYDVRAPIALEDPTRGDLARETKQVLAYGAVSRVLCSASDDRRFERLYQALEHAVNALVGLLGYHWVGLDALTLEPLFRGDGARNVPFDQLPTSARHLTAFAALAVRALWAAYPQRHPLESQGIVAIDEVELHQDLAVLKGLPSAFRTALPEVQWIVTTSSAIVAASTDVNDVIALRQSTNQAGIELFTGEMARTH